MGLQDRQTVTVQIGEGERALTFGRTLIRVQPRAFTEMHIDTDEGNAAGIGPETEGQIARGVSAHVGC